jgi:hypothetical protein
VDGVWTSSPGPFLSFFSFLLGFGLSLFFFSFSPSASSLSFFHHAVLSMSFISFCFAQILFLIVVILVRVVMEHMEFYFVDGWMKCLLASSVEA